MRRLLVVALALLALPACTREFPNPIDANAASEPLQLEAGAALVAPLEQVQLGVRGGDAGCYSFTCLLCPSGGTVTQEPCAATASYRAGPGGDVSDRLSVADVAGTTREVAVSVGAALAVFPAAVALTPLSTQDFLIAGGKPQLVDGRPVFEACLLDDAGGCIDELPDGSSLARPVDGQAKFFTVTVGSAGERSLRIRVTDALGAVALASISVGGALALSPPEITLSPGERLAFTARGGQPPYRFFLPAGQNGAGATLDGGSGELWAGAAPGAVTSVRVQDARGAIAAATVFTAGQLQGRDSVPGLIVTELRSPAALSVLGGAQQAAIETIHGMDDDADGEPGYDFAQSDRYAVRLRPLAPLVAEGSSLPATALAAAHFFGAEAQEVARVGGAFPSTLELVEFGALRAEWAVRHELAVPGRALGLALGDVDADGVPELALLSSEPDMLRLFAVTPAALTLVDELPLDGAARALVSLELQPGAASFVVAAGSSLQLVSLQNGSLKVAWSRPFASELTALAPAGAELWVAETGPAGAAVHALSVTAQASGEPRELATLSAASALASGDLDGDGRLDLLGLDGESARLLVRLGVDGGFQDESSCGVAPRATQLAVRDVNGDGFDDVLVGSETSRVSYFWGNEFGLGNRRKWRLPPAISTEGSVQKLLRAELRGGGGTDLVSLSHLGVPETLLARDDTFLAAEVPDRGFEGALDVAAAAGTVVALRPGGRALLAWRLDAATGALVPAELSVPGLEAGACARISVATGAAGELILACVDSSGELRAALLDGPGGAASVTLPLRGDQLVTADMDGDGAGELIAVDLSAGRAAVFRVAASGELPVLREEAEIDLGGAASGFVLGDFDGANGLDVAFLRLGAADPTVVAFRGANGRFADPVALNRKQALAGASCDFDGDGRADLALVRPHDTNPARSVLELFVYDDRFGFRSLGEQELYVIAAVAECADLNGDGNADLLLADPQRARLFELWGRGGGDFITGAEDP